MWISAPFEARAANVSRWRAPAFTAGRVAVPTSMYGVHPVDDLGLGSRIRMLQRESKLAHEDPAASRTSGLSVDRTTKREVAAEGLALSALTMIRDRI
jgi:hypothetical protein